MLFVDFKIFILLSSFITVISGLECKENEARAQKYENVAVQSNGCSKPSFIQVADEEVFTHIAVIDMMLAMLLAMPRKIFAMMTF